MFVGIPYDHKPSALKLFTQLICDYNYYQHRTEQNNIHVWQELVGISLPVLLFNETND